MILFPAIDLKDGACVRLLRGDMRRATVFGHDPAGQARVFAAAGCQWLHVVDLDGAVAGHAVNAASVMAILAAVTIPVQLGGGIRGLDAVVSWLDRGVARVVLGTVAVRDPGLVKSACRRFPGKIAVAIDASDGRVAVEGWTSASDVTAIDLARRFEDAGVAALVHTDIDRDGALAGPNLDASVAIAAEVSTPVIVSGGVSTLDQVRAIRARESDGIAGTIVGRALYDGGLRLDEALAAAC